MRIPEKALPNDVKQPSLRLKNDAITYVQEVATC